jgi:hypothetical protein
MIEIGTGEATWVEVEAARTVDSAIGRWLFYILRDGTEGLASPSQWRIRQGWRLNDQTLALVQGEPASA